MKGSEDMFGRIQIPVFVINGFLESGKTTFIRETVIGDPNLQNERIVIICCEEGETEYGMLPSNTTVCCVENKEDFTDKLLVDINEKYKPTYVFIEYNGMWGMETIYKTKVPPGWKVVEQITVVDAETFESYFANMKSIFADMFRASTTVFMNRCTRGDNFKFFKDNIKWCAPHAEIMYVSDDEGYLDITLEEDLPYDLNAEVITLNNDSYMTWYIDMTDNPNRYVGKTVEYTGQVMKPPYFRGECFVAGNMVMTCCEDDMQFLGFVCQYDKALLLKEDRRMRVRAKVHYEFAPEYEMEGPVLYVEKTTTVQGLDKKRKKK